MQVTVEKLGPCQARVSFTVPSDEFQGRLLEVNDGLTDFSYAPESYDATILAALAAVKGGATDAKPGTERTSCAGNPDPLLA